MQTLCRISMLHFLLRFRHSLFKQGGLRLAAVPGGRSGRGASARPPRGAPSARLPSPAPVLSPDALLPAHRPRRPLPSGPVTPQSGHQAQWRWAVTAPDRPLSLHLPRRPAAENSDIHKWRRFKVSGALLPSLRPALHPHAEYPPPAPPARRPRRLLDRPALPPQPPGSGPFLSVRTLASAVLLQSLTLQLLRPRRASLQPSLTPPHAVVTRGRGHLAR